jgi:hypothetical protein
MAAAQTRAMNVELLKWLNSCFDKWIEGEFILWSPGHKVVQRSSSERAIVWATYDPKLFKPTTLVWSSISEYLDILRSSQYSALLFDGSIIQLTVDYSKLDCVGHRYAYYPCPIWLAPGEMAIASASGLPLDEYLQELVLTARSDQLRNWPTMRFDYASTEVLNEPFSHVHLGPENCRVPILGPMTLHRFLDFIVRIFYSHEVPPADPKLTFGIKSDATLRKNEHDPVHLAWK